MEPIEITLNSGEILSFDFNFAMFNSSNWNPKKWEYFSYYNHKYTYLDNDK